MHGVDVVAQGGGTGSLHQEGPPSCRGRSRREAKGKAISRSLDTPSCQQRRWAGKPARDGQARELRVRKDHSQSPPKESQLQHPTPVCMPPEWGLTLPAAPTTEDGSRPLSLGSSIRRAPRRSVALLREENVTGLFLTKKKKKQGWPGDRVLGALPEVPPGPVPFLPRDLEKT